MFMKCSRVYWLKKRKILFPKFHKIPIPKKIKFFSTSWLFFLDSMDLWHIHQNIQNNLSKNEVYKF